MTCSELARIITRRIVVRAQEEPDPVAYFSRAMARAVMLQCLPVEEQLSALLQFGREFGLLVQGIEKDA